MGVNDVFGNVNYVICSTTYFSFTVFLKIIRFYCLIIHRYFSGMQSKSRNENDLGLDPFFREAFFFIDFNPRTNKDIITLSLLFIGDNQVYIISFIRSLASQSHFPHFYEIVSVSIVT